MYRLAFTALALVLSLGASAQADVTMFPPENESECHTGSVLRWDGPGHNVRCENAAPAGMIIMMRGACPAGWTAVPELAGRSVIGTGDYNEGGFSHTYVPGETGGTSILKLSLENMPKHSHEIRLTEGPDDFSISRLWPADYGGYGYLEFDWMNIDVNNGPYVDTGTTTTRYGHSLLGARGDNLGPFASAKYTGGNKDSTAGEGVGFDNRSAYIALNFCEKLP
jgi:hypothetical protein